MFVLKTVLEFAVAAFIIWGIFNEQKLVRFEDRIAARIKARRKASQKRNDYYHDVSDTDRHCA